MSRSPSSSERIVIVGGGFAGLSAAVRLAQSGLSVTVLEASNLGYAASTRNQGWLHSGAWFAKTAPQLARFCYESLQQTIEFCPECLEPDLGSMIYCSLADQLNEQEWTQAWDTAEIPYQSLLDGELNWTLPQISRDNVSWALRLPDRSFRPDVLLAKLAATARDAGAEIRAGAHVSELLIEDQEVFGVRIGADEELHAQLVILAIGAFSKKSFPPLFRDITGRQADYQLVCLRTHLSAIQPGLSADPFCIVDGDGFNHLPHGETSVFGSGHWEVVTKVDESQVVPAEIEKIEQQLQQLYPNGFGEDVERRDWTGTTVQAMHVDQIEPGVAPLPTLVDHSRQPCGMKNVLSIFPGRATLWSHLAERVQHTVLEKVNKSDIDTAHPPWNAMM